MKNAVNDHIKRFNRYLAVWKIAQCGADDESLTYEYKGFYDELMEEEVESIMSMVNEQKRKYGIE